MPLVRIDVTDPGFKGSIQDLPTDFGREVLLTLLGIDRNNIQRATFIGCYGWAPLNLVGCATYPGANDFHNFIIPTSFGHVQITAYEANLGELFCIAAVPL